MSQFNSDELDEICFDPNDEISYYYGDLNRDEVKDVLNEASIGTFLIRDSTKDIDQKVLCVKEAPKVINNYKIIQKRSEQSASYEFYLFGKEDCLFPSISSILEFYSTHYLNQSPLVRPAFHHKKVIALYDFSESQDPTEDLYFKEGEILTVIEYTQGNEWWKAINQIGKCGLIPVPLIRRIKPNETPLVNHKEPIQETKRNEEISIDDSTLTPSTNTVTLTVIEASKTDEKNSDIYNSEDSKLISDDSQTGPFTAKVIEDYTPSPYEHSHIKLRKGQFIKVLEMKSDGKWLGELNDGKKGLFPFNRVELVRD